MKRYLAPLLITGILVSAHLSVGILEGYSRTGLAILVASWRAGDGPAVRHWRIRERVSPASAWDLVRSPFLWAPCCARWSR
jgi:hypothetical protein